MDAQFAPYTGKGTGEQTLADSFWYAIPSRSVLLFDRGFNHVARMVRYGMGASERYLVTRERSSFRYERVAELGKYEELVRCAVPESERKADSKLPEYLVLRRITYKIAGHPPNVLLTTLLDPIAYPQKEVVAVYHERWAIELTYRDIKTTQICALKSLRRKTVEGIEQVLWGILVAYQLIQKRMHVAPSDTRWSQIGSASRRLSSLYNTSA